MPAKKPMSEWKHGTHGTYVNGCRCEPCRQASNAYKKELYHRTLEKSRRYFRERYHRRQGRKAIGTLDATLIRRDEEYRRIVATAEGELAELIAQQNRDDVTWVRPDPRVVRSFDPSRWGGWGERDGHIEEGEYE